MTQAERSNCHFKYSSKQGHVFYTPKQAQAFLHHVLENKRLPIAKHLHEFDDVESFFLIAGTGLGKTVAIPVYLWLRGMQRQSAEDNDSSKTGPRVWVVEPKIAIVQGLQAEMTDEWERFQKNERLKKRSPFGCKTKVDRVNVDAPIVFITTGIFSIYARKGLFKTGRDIVLMDEAHETLETDSAVELGVGICRGREIETHFMSATIDAADIRERLAISTMEIRGKRFPIWKHNTKKPLEACVVDLVEQTLVRQNLGSEFYPKSGDPVYRDIVGAVTESRRTKGMLIIVNSFSGERSDARRIEQLLRNAPYARSIEIGMLASEVLRDPKRRRTYMDTIERWKREKTTYVLIATSVVEMGVTLPDLDYIVTMDVEFGERESNALKRVELGTNSLIQRIGRVGRIRSGIAYITNEVGASYSELDDDALNKKDALAPEPIRFPMESGSLAWLAYESLARKWSEAEIRQRLKADLRLPTPIQDMPERMRQLIEDRRVLVQIGAADDDGVSEEGRLLERWIGRMHPACALDAHRAYREGKASRVLRALCEGILHEYPLTSVCNAEAYRRYKESDVMFYLSFVLLAGKMHTYRNRSWGMRYLWKEGFAERIILYEVREGSLYRAFVLLSEYIDVFFEVIASEPAVTNSKKTSGMLRNCQDSIHAFLKMKSC